MSLGRSHCVGKGMELVSITLRAKRNFLSSLITSEGKIGHQQGKGGSIQLSLLEVVYQHKECMTDWIT